MRSALYRGTLSHVRTTPARNAFRYPVCFYALDLDELTALDRRLHLFAYNRPGVLSLRDGDHLGDPARPIKENVLAHLAAHGVDLAGGRVVLLANLRLLGYVFNPVSFFYCYGADGALACILAEVGNTFGERHPYLLTPERQVRGGGEQVRVYEHPKELHVSPFFGMEQTYRFSFTEPGERVHAGVALYEGGARPFSAVLSGRREPLTDRSLARALVRYPLMSQAVTGLIHWQALRLLAKGVPVHHKPTFTPGAGSERPATLADRAPVSEAPRGCPRHAPSESGRHLRPLPAARPTPLAAVAKGLTLWALGRPARGEVTLRLPDGTVRRAGDPTTGPRATVTVRSKDLYRRLAWRKRIGIGEAYVAGDWTTDDLPGLIEILAWSSESARHHFPGPALERLQRRRPRLPTKASMSRSARDIRYHYDLGNDLYRLFLDPSLTYSCAVFEHPEQSLQDAQEAKYRRICARLDLHPGDHVLEIGCGWGGFARHAAGEWGARVTGLTLSRAQHDLARERAVAAGLGDRIDIRLQDYRELTGRFDKIASIEMFEALGDGQFGVFFAACDRLLAPEGLALIQTIAVPDARFERYRRTDDFIREHIFPGALIPSLDAFTRAMARSSAFVVEGVENIGPHYAETLRQWRERFLANREEVLALGYDERFVRAWEWYLAFCEVAFRTRLLHDYQVLLSRPMNVTTGLAGWVGEAAPSPAVSEASP